MELSAENVCPRWSISSAAVPESTGIRVMARMSNEARDYALGRRLVYAVPEIGVVSAMQIGFIPSLSPLLLKVRIARIVLQRWSSNLAIRKDEWQMRSCRRA